MLVLTFEKKNPEIVGNKYLVLGTLDPSSWRKREKEPISMENIEDHVHDFKKYLEVEYIPPHWGPVDETNPKAVKR